MSTSLGSPRPSWFVRDAWIPVVLASVSLIAMATVSAMVGGEGLGVVSRSWLSRTPRTACDCIVERLLTTRDPVELE